MNRSKRGVVLDLKQPDGPRRAAAPGARRRRAGAQLPARACRSGWASTTSSCSAINPRLIYCAVTGYGETGPLKDKAGYDQVLQTMTGMCALQGKRGGPPEIIYGSVVDYYAAALVAAGVASALYERERSGLGQYVGVSLLRSALTMQSARLVWAEGEPRDIGRDMRSGGITGIHPTREGYLYISANTPHFWSALCEKTGLHELARRPALRQRAQARRSTQPRSCRACTPRWPRAARWNGRRCSATRCRAPPRARSRTCSTIRRCWPKTWSARIEHPTLGPLPRLHAADQVRPHARAGAVRRADARAGFGGVRRMARRSRAMRR